jgi:hypothetical protein
MAVKDVVAEDERDRCVADETGSDPERFGDAVGMRLLGVSQRQAEMRAVAEHRPEQG